MSYVSDRLGKLSPRKLELLAHHLQAQVETLEQARREPIAVIGLGCRFPGDADTPEEFWHLLRDGIDAITEVPKQRWDLEALYDPDPDAPGKIASRWGGFLSDIDRFDSEFFGISPREAASMDPQQRLLLEVSWAALENAGQVPDRLAGSRTGVFVGIVTGDYSRLHLTQCDPERIDGYFATGNASSVAGGRLSYLLGLQGPCMAIDTACSSSLVAVHLACQSLRSRECNMALAGGVSLILSPELTITFSKAHLLAPDGRCKAFDARADGYVRSDGCGVVILKRLSDALADRDRILAVLKGSAINQDGKTQGLPAPSGPAQGSVIREALANAGVAPAEVTYIEAHGSGTALGDPIEFGALAEVFADDRDGDHPLLLGSVKSNIGHAEGAAGIAGLIKAVLAVERRAIPPHLHFRTPNPHIAPESIPAAVVTELMPWPDHGHERIAGVSSFGFSGTNIHVVVGEAPPPPPAAECARPLHLLTLSTRDPAALPEAARRWARFLEEASEVSVGDLCASAHCDRSHFEHRLAVCAASVAEFREALAGFSETGHGSEELFRGRVHVDEPPGIGFFFPAEGSAYAGMAADLAATQPTFRACLERCDEAAGDLLEQPLSVLLSAPAAELEALLREPRLADPLLCAVEWALSELWRFWGIEPVALLGHGVGEYAAACAAGVLSPEDALRLVAARARRPEEGGEPAPELRCAAARLPLISAATGELWGEEPTAAVEHFVRLARTRPPRDAAAGWERLRQAGCELLVAAGPTSAALEPMPDEALRVLPSLRCGSRDWRQLLATLAELYVGGAAVDWRAFEGDAPYRRVALPPYPFKRRRHWFTDSVTELGAEAFDADPRLEYEAWFSVPGWRRRPLPEAAPLGEESSWLLLIDETGLGGALAERLAAAGQRVERLAAGAGFGRRDDGSWVVDPAAAEDYAALFEELGRVPERIVHLWNFGDARDAERGERWERSFYSLLALARALDGAGPTGEVDLTVVSSGLHRVTGDEVLEVDKAPLVGPCRVLGIDLPKLRCRSVDLASAARGPVSPAWVGQLLAEIAAGTGEAVVAYRGDERWVEDFEPLPAPAEEAVTRLRRGGVYLITGGLGGIGLDLAEHLVRHHAARLVLVGRSGLPKRSSWEQSATALGDDVARRIRRVRDLEQRGAEVLVLAADVTDAAAMRRVVARAVERFGRIDGVIHAAGLPGQGLAQLKTRAVAARVLAPKVEGTLVLEEVLADVELDFLALCSSTVVLAGGPGQIDYCAANAFLDAFAEERSGRGRRTVAIAWGEWQWNGWEEGLSGFGPELAGALKASRAKYGIHSAEGGRAFERALAAERARVIISPRPLRSLAELGRCFTLDRIVRRETAEARRDPEPVFSAEPLERRIAETWRQHLGVQKIGRDDNFFDLGGNSLLGMQVLAELRQQLGRSIPSTLLFEAPTVATLVAALSPQEESSARRLPARRREAEQGEIAIIGMAGRFPGAPNVDEFWWNLCAQVESVTFFSDDELAAAGVDPAWLGNPHYVKAGAVLDDIDRFDAELFGYSPREAELMDPQHRFFLECVWEALENAGYDPQRYPGSIGLFGGSDLSTYLFNVVAAQGGSPDPLQAALFNLVDSLTTKVSYKLNLRGPSVAVQSFCSTSAVASHLACRSLARGDCDIALAGGVRIAVPHRTGYLWQPGSIDSPDGHTRTFDVRGQGVLLGNGVAVLVLKRLADALAEGDHVYAVIKGTAMNNDGSLKVGYTAPSVEAQAAVISAAFADAGVEPASVGYIEAHGTGTELGDPVEVAALRKAFHGAGRDFSCALGSVKTNVGHLDRASGATSLIKTALALHHGRIPATLHFERPNPQLRLDEGPFFVNTELRAWPAGEAPRRAGVNVLGVGGTNVHFILEEAPAGEGGSASRAAQMILVSANDEEALERATANLAEYLGRDPAPELADVAYTQQVGRRLLPHRRMLVAHGLEDAREALSKRDPQRLISAFEESRNRSLVFLFPGLGDHYPGMARELYETEPTFREHLDQCAEKLEPHLGLDLRELLFPVAGDAAGAPAKPDLRSLFTGRGRRDAASRRLNQTSVAQPAVFALEYALARLLSEWLGEPKAAIGYSLGEYTAACVAGVLSLDDALELVARRAQMIDELPGGAMLAVPLSAAEVEPLVGDELSLAAENGPRLTVLAGPEQATAAAEEKLTAQGVACRRLVSSHAFHSRMMEPIVERFTELVSRFELRPPRIPFVSNVTGRFIRDQDATDPGYWARHLVQPVRFGKGLATLLETSDQLLLEVGPGQTLGSFAKQHPAYGDKSRPPVLATLPSVFFQEPEQRFLLTTLGRLWLAGVAVDWAGFYRHEKRRRLPLPTYPFADRRFWIGGDPHRVRPAAAAPAVAGKTADVGEWFFRPVWQSAELPCSGGPAKLPDAGRWLLLVDSLGVGKALAEQLRAAGGAVVTVEEGAEFRRLGRDQFAFDPRRVDHYRALFEALRDEDALPTHAVHLGSLTGAAGRDFDAEQEAGFYTLIHLVQAMAELGIHDPLNLEVVADGLWPVTGGETLRPEKATLLGPCKVIPQEFPHIACRAIDVVVPAAEETSVADQLFAELAADPADRVVAHRRGERWVRTFAPEPLAAPEGHGALRPGGVYLITGGLGGDIGFVLAEFLARELGAKLVLTGRSELPDRAAWPEWLAAHDADEATARKILRIRHLEELGGEVLAPAADVADGERMAAVVALAEQRFGALHGLIHTAGIAAPDSFRGLHQMTRRESELHFRPKVHGLYALERVLAGRTLDFRLLFSSSSAVLGGITLAAYAAANLFMDSFARQRNHESDERWISVNWDPWDVGGEALRSLRERGMESTGSASGMTSQEGVEAFRRVVAAEARELVHSTGDLEARLAQWVQRRPAASPAAAPTGSLYARPNLQTVYVAAQSTAQREIAEVFQQVLGVEEVGIHDNYFDLGGTSLSAVQAASSLQEKFDTPVSPVLLFEAPTVSELAKRLRPQGGEEPSAALQAAVARRRRPRAGEEDDSIAIIGMAGRFPRARDLGQFWHNLAHGLDTLTQFSDEELRASGVSEEELGDPHYVRRRPIIEDAELFDASFFGYSPRDAELMDPQHRVFLETAWQALEGAGYDTLRYPGAVGIFAGSNISTYMLGMLGGEILGSVSDLETAISNDRDSLATRVSYKLNLKGPSMTVQTFCSTSLVATHLACRSLLHHECEMALAGGVSIRVPQKAGYRFDPGGQDSPDGYTRTFDAKARGTTFGDGVGVVVLKRLADAMRDGDTIHAVIKGSAINNDGSLKIGYTAPSVEAQAEVVAAALASAGVSAETIDYVEAHGSATELGDPIEVEALTRAFRLDTQARGFCALGSVKSNTGHLDRAAGVTGLIKTVLALEHEALPPLLHFEEPNPEIDFESSPFFVNTELREWKAQGRPRRAGVNSLGVGGTNVHMVLEQAPASGTGAPGRSFKLLPLSAKTETALATATGELAAALRDAMGCARLPLADVAYTLQVGRRQFPCRCFTVCRDGEEAAASLEAPAPGKVFTGLARPVDPQVAFLFPGIGDHYLDMGAGLYRDEPVFRQEVDRCAELLTAELGLDLRKILFSGRDPGAAAGRRQPDLRSMLGRGSPAQGEASRRLHETQFAHPAVFTVEYALARLLSEWGIRPQAFMGYSIGEYVAATLAGVFELEDALRLVARRARLIRDLPAGAMLAVPMPDEEAAALGREGVFLAAVNGPAVSILSGPAAAIAEVEAELEARDVVCRRLATTHAFHSEMMAAIADEVRELVDGMPLAAPRIPFVSNVTGTWIDPAQATDPGYWVRHLCETVRFADGVATLLEEPERVLVEVGPGQGLSSFVKIHPACDEARARCVVPAMRSVHEGQPDQATLLTALGKLWLTGVEIDWNGFYAGEKRRRVPLPTYPFERQRYWAELRPLAEVRSGAARGGVGTKPIRLADLEKAPDVGEWFYLPSWRQTPPLMTGANSDGDGDASGASGTEVRWLLLGGDEGLGGRLAERLSRSGRQVLRVSADSSFARRDLASYALDPRQPDHFRRLLGELKQDGRVPDRVVHLWSLGEAPELEPALDLGFYALIYLAQTLSDVTGERPTRCFVVSDGLQSVTGEETLQPVKAPLIGPCRVIPQEYPHLSCRSVDVALPPAGSRREEVLVEQLFAELTAETDEAMVAYRGTRRWVQGFEPLRLEREMATAAPLRRGGVYLITGGLGGIGLAVAEHLHCTLGARLVLLGRSGLPPRDQWTARLEQDDALAEKIRQVQALEHAGAEVLVLAADVADREAMGRAVAQGIERFGTLHGIFHTAGVPAAGLMQLRTRETAAAVLAPKVDGTLVLEEVTAELPLDFLALFSSMTSATGGGPGQVDYCAANAFLDAYAHSRAQDGRRIVSMDWGEWQWDAWQEGLMGFDPQIQAFFKENRRKFGITFAEGMDALERMLAAGQPQVVVSTQDFRAMMALTRDFTVAKILEMAHPGDGERVRHPRPLLGSSFVTPSSELEKKIAAIWCDLLRLEQIGIQDNFFELGGNSLLGVDLIRRMKNEFEVEIPLHALYDASTVSAMSVLLGEPSATAASLDERRERGTERRERAQQLKQRAQARKRRARAEPAAGRLH